MPRILIISENWPLPVSETGTGISDALSGAGFDVDVITNEHGVAAGAQNDPIANLIRLPVESPRTSGALFKLRNALFFDTAANPGNYAQFRDRLHMHLQDVLYEVVVVFCPPQIYLRLGYWIGETFGIPVWIHVTQGLSEAGSTGFAAWNRRRLHRRYLGAANVITAGSVDLLRNIPRQPEQLAFVTVPQGAMTFLDPETQVRTDARSLLARIIRKRAD